jgi:ubiquinone/menaquinone biosynthesis C-methylase UbiE
VKLKHFFDQWGRRAQQDYADKQWLLSKWEVNEGIEWPQEKTQVLLASLQRGLQLQPSHAFIELGCAGGWILERLGPAVLSYYGLDFSMNMLRFASARLKAGHLCCGEIGRLPIGDGRFDRVLSYYVFLNFDDDRYVQASLKEIHRVLKPGGRALVGQLPHKDGSVRYEAAKEHYARYCQEHFKVGKSIREEFKPPLRLFDKNELAAFLKSQGISHHFQPSFNPFYFHGEPETVDWRFDLILTK